MSQWKMIWKKASASGSGGNCVEVFVDRDLQIVLIRDSKNRNAGTLGYTFDEWDAFVDGVKKGEFDNYKEQKDGTPSLA